MSESVPDGQCHDCNPFSVKERRAQFRALVGAFNDSLDGTKRIYHYTSAQGLRGIIDTGELWLTNTEFVNDTTECRALWGLTDLFRKGELKNRFVRQCWEAGIASHKNSGAFGGAYDYGLLGRDDDSGLYVASFSKDRDSLEQWRAYGGFCIGFNVSKMARKNFRLNKCVYRDKDVHDWIIRKSSLREWDGDNLGEDKKSAAARALFRVAEVKYKNPHYKNEREVRLVAVSCHRWGFYSDSPDQFANEPAIHFRDHPVYKIPVPYVKFFVSSQEAQMKWHEGTRGEEPIRVKRRRLKEEDEAGRDFLPITEVVIGPIARKEEARRACEILLQEKGYKDVPVQVPDIPYRGV